MRRLLAWLSKRFPEQRIVSLAEYNALNNSMSYLSQHQNEMNIRMVAIEAQLKRLNDMNGYVSSSKERGFKLER